ncbi:MAG: hypothetical protein JWO43_29 [Candidatus Adlerbacteria bacterium]|nr:hypothetical protein [Candidatus Adlerbacteria bacterium]
MNRLGRILHHHFVPSEHNSYRPHILRRSWLVFFLTLALVAEGFLVSNLITRQTSATFLAAVLPGEVINLTNTERKGNKVGTVTENAKLDAAAAAKAADMAAKGYFSHVGPDGKQPWLWIDAAGYNYQYAGENLAVRFVDSKDVVNAWMASPSHRANIVKGNYTEIGVGVANGTYQGQPAVFVVQYFASPAPSVLGAATGPAEVAAAGSQKFMQSFLETLRHIEANPRTATGWVLGGIVALLVVALVLAFVVHIQIQPTSMLVAGSLVTAFALSILIFNSNFLGGTIAADNSASVAGGAAAIDQGGVVIDPAAATTSR